MRSLSTILATLALAGGVRAQTVHFVDDSATGAGDGTSWQDAFPELPAAIAAAAIGDQVWVAEGTYHASSDRDRFAQLEIAVELYGGFDGTETSLAQRAGLFDATVVSGDLLGDDGPGFTNVADNSEAALFLLDGAVLDGFTYTAMVRDVHDVRFCEGSPVIRNCVFAGNFGGYGGACNLLPGEPRFEDCTFRGNLAENSGGATNGGTFTTFERCTFTDNEAAAGGGSTCRGHYVDCVFERNQGGWGAGAIYSSSSGGETEPHFVIERCTFTDNVAATGAVRGHATVRDSIFTGNSYGAVQGYLLVIEDCIFEGNASVDRGVVSARASFAHSYAPNHVRRCTFRGNQSARGGALFAETRLTLIVEDCVFEDNQAERGGAVFLDSPDSRARVSGCAFARNRATQAGGALFACMGTTVERCTFEANEAGTRGGALAFAQCSNLARVLSSRFVGNRALTGGGGAIAVEPGYGSLELVGCELSGNRADGTSEGGGALWLTPELGGPTRVLNATFHANSAAGSAGGGGLAGNPYEVVGSIFRGNVAAGGTGQSAQLLDTRPDDGRFRLIACAVEGFTGAWGEDNHGGDPLFVDAAGADGVVGTLDDDLRLGPGSSCIDLGSEALYHLVGATGLEPAPATDVAGQPRFFDALACGEVLDMGARERRAADGQNLLCVGQPSSLGLPAGIDAPCAVSPTAGTFVVAAEPVPQGGVFFASRVPASLPAGNGLLCLGPPRVRLGGAPAVAGRMELELDPMALAAGTVWYVQAAYRDPAAGGAGFDFSSAATIVVRP